MHQGLVSESTDAYDLIIIGGGPERSLIASHSGGGREQYKPWVRWRHQSCRSEKVLNSERSKLQSRLSLEPSHHRHWHHWHDDDDD